MSKNEITLKCRVDFEFDGDPEYSAAISRIVRAALLIWQRDPHTINSGASCTTCSILTELIGEPYGCCVLRGGRVGAKKRRVDTV